MAKSSALEILYGLGYEPVDIESDADYIRALKESYNKLQIENASDPRLIELVDAIKGFRHAKSRKEAAKSGGKSRAAKRRQPKLSADEVKAQIDAKEKKKNNAMNFISPGSAPLALPPAEDEGGGDMSGALMKISNDVNIIKGIVAAENKIEGDKADDTREAREKRKRSMAENIMEGGKEGFKKVTSAVGKILEPAKGIFSKIFDFLKLFLLGSGLMMLLDWMGNPDNTKKIQSLIRFLKDFWPIIAAAVIAFFPGLPAITAGIALATQFLPKIINLIKSIFGLGKDVDKEIAKNEKNLLGDDVKDDTTIEKEEKDSPPPPPEQQQDKPQEMNKGGEVPGSGDTDTVPAMLTPGEFVLTKEAVKQYGVDSLYAMNAAAGGVGKSNDVPREPDGKPMKKKSEPRMKTPIMRGSNTINNTSKSMNMGGFVDNFAMGDYYETFGNVYMNRGGLVKQGDVRYISRGGDVQHMFMGGMVKNVGNVLSKTPQARLLKFAGNQIKKLPVPPPAAKALKALKKLGGVPSAPTQGGGSTSGDGDGGIPNFSARAPGGRAKELTLGIRR